MLCINISYMELEVKKYLTIKYNTLIVLKSYFNEIYVVIFYKSKVK